jgi:preprotein translocase subunit SecD
MEERFLEASMFLLAIYFIVSQIMMIYFWYTIAQLHGFAYTLFIGPFEAEIKGLLWPFFI